MDRVGMISRDTIEKGELPEEVIYIAKISDVGDFFSLYLVFVLEKYSRPSIREFLESYDF
jgi:hypothetical protein